jgi:hypothetical protein
MANLYLKFESPNADTYDNFIEHVSNHIITESSNTVTSAPGKDVLVKLQELTDNNVLTCEYYFDSHSAIYKLIFDNSSDSSTVLSLINAISTWTVITIIVMTESDFDTALGSNSLKPVDWQWISIPPPQMYV